MFIGHSRRIITPACHAAGTKRGVAAEPIIGRETWPGDHDWTSTSSSVQCGVRSAREEILTGDGKHDGRFASGGHTHGGKEHAVLLWRLNGNIALVYNRGAEMSRTQRG